MSEMEIFRQLERKTACTALFDRAAVVSLQDAGLIGAKSWLAGRQLNLVDAGLIRSDVNVISVPVVYQHEHIGDRRTFVFVHDPASEPASALRLSKTRRNANDGRKEKEQDSLSLEHGAHHSRYRGRWAGL